MSSMHTQNDVLAVGNSIISTRPNSVVQYRILRDVMQLPSRSTELDAAHSQLISHPWVVELAHEQHPDGSWGRFHSMDSSLKTRFPTSEIAIRRALALGLEKDDPVLVQAVRYMVAILDGRQNVSDHVEKSEGWPIGVDYFTADIQNPSHFHIFNWLESMEILSCFQTWREVAAGGLAWLWEQRGAHGLWDFGETRKTHYFPLSDNWRKKGTRSIDHSTRCLALFSRFNTGT